MKFLFWISQSFPVLYLALSSSWYHLFALIYSLIFYSLIIEVFHCHLLKWIFMNWTWTSSALLVKFFFVDWIANLRAEIKDVFSISATCFMNYNGKYLTMSRFRALFLKRSIRKPSWRYRLHLKFSEYLQQWTHDKFVIDDIILNDWNEI